MMFYEIWQLMFRLVTEQQDAILAMLHAIRCHAR